MPEIAMNFGGILRDWRQRRRMSQLGLAVTADVSQRHLSFVESGRAQPSRDMVMRLAEHLAVPMRERNALLVAAGYAPMHSERSLDDPEMEGARAAIEMVLSAHDPFPSLAVDRHWTLVAANKAVDVFLAGVDETLLRAPINALRLSLHPKGLAPRIVNLAEWRDHILARLSHQIEQSADRQLMALMGELKAYPAPYRKRPPTPRTAIELAGIAVPMQVTTDAGLLTFLSTTTIFGTPVDITLSELAIETFLPANAETGAALRRLADSRA